MQRVLGMVFMAAALASCGGSAAGGSADGPDDAQSFTIEIVADDFSFAVPEVVPAGQVEISLENTGKQPHQALIYRLNNNVAYEDYVAAVLEDDANVPALSERLGGVNWGLGAGDSQIDRESKPYEPGTYAVICFIRDPDSGKSHLTLGMISRFTVE